MYGINPNLEYLESVMYTSLAFWVNNVHKYKTVFSIRIRGLTQIIFFFREWRLHAHLSQKQLAKRVGRTAATVSRIENGMREITRDYLVKFAEAVGCRPGDPINRPPEKISIDEIIETSDAHDEETERIIKQKVIEFLKLIDQSKKE